MKAQLTMIRMVERFTDSSGQVRVGGGNDQRITVLLDAHDARQGVLALLPCLRVVDDAEDLVLVLDQKRPFFVAVAIQTSRSVITPITFPSTLSTGSAPQSLSHIILAAAARLVPGPQHCTSRVMMSWTFMGMPPSL